MRPFYNSRHVTSGLSVQFIFLHLFAGAQRPAIEGLDEFCGGILGREGQRPPFRFNVLSDSLAKQPENK